MNKAIAVAGNFLNVKPLMTFRDGEIIRAGLVRTVPQGINRIVRFIESKVPISELMIVHSEIPEQAEQLKTMASKYIHSNRSNRESTWRYFRSTRRSGCTHSSCSLARSMNLFIYLSPEKISSDFLLIKDWPDKGI